MARKGISTLVADVDAIATHLKTRIDEVPQFAGLLEELETWLAAARSLESQREVSTGRLRRIDEQRRVSESRGVELRVRAAQSLRGFFGTRAKVLLEFGVRPLSSGRRKPETPEQTPAPPGEPEAA